MLKKPSIIKMPSAAFPVTGGITGCAGSGYKFADGTICQGQFNCVGAAYNDNCIDAYSCSSSLLGGALIGGATLYTAGMFLTGVIVIT